MRGFTVILLSLVACKTAVDDTDSETDSETDVGDTDTDDGDTDDPAPMLCPDGVVEAVRTTYDPEDTGTPLENIRTSWYSSDGSVLLGFDDDSLTGELQQSLRQDREDGRVVALYNATVGMVSTTTFAWAADGSMMVEELDAQSDGTIEDRETNTYDAQGRRLSWEVDDNADDVIESFHEWTWQDDHPLTYRTDLNATGEWDQTTVYTLDAQSRPLYSEKSVLNREPDPNEIEVWTYDGACLTSYRTENYFFANPVLRQWTYTCDSEGRRIGLELDGDDDGIVDSSAELVLDEEGNVVEENHFEGGTLASTTWRTFDADGWQTSEERDQDGDGVLDRRWTETWTCVQAVPTTPLLPDWAD